MKLFVAALLLHTAVVLAHAAAVTPALRDITVEAGTTSATITLVTTARVEKVVLQRKGNGLAEVRMRPVAADRAALASARPKPGVRSIRAWIERRDVLIADVMFARQVTGMEIARRDNNHVVVRVTLGKAIGPATDSASASSPASSRERSRWELKTIVIDAGHGGKDPGAIGIGDVREKDVTLAVARRLRDELRKRLPAVRVVMTRDADTFVELYRRGQIANQRRGRLFVSIHCNSMPEKPHPASGFECYILSPGRSAEAARVAAEENGAVRYETDRARYDDLSAESTIMAGMAQSAFARYSEMAAESIQSAMAGKTGIPDRGLHQAGFFVLVGASMPGVLVEIGYLSNEKDAAVLASAKGQARIARAIATGIDAYARRYASTLED